MSSIEETLDRIERDNYVQRQKTEVIETAEEIRSLGHFGSLESAVDYVSAYETAFNEVDGAIDYVDQYSSSLESLDGITESLL